MFKRLQIDHTNRSVDVFAQWRKSGDLELNTPYQRGDVWGVTRRRNFLKSLLIGIPVSSIIINDRFSAEYDGDGNNMMAVIDGKQRITTILMFLDNEISIPSCWIESSNATSRRTHVTYESLSIANQRRFRQMTISVAEARLPTLACECEVFDLVNFGGLKQGEKDEDV